MEIRLIAFDLDSTLLTDRKQISERTMRALGAAAEKGIILVPSTGRIRGAIPQVLRELPFIRYLITVNGAAVWDTEEEKLVYRKVFEPDQGLRIWDAISRYDSMNDIYADGQGWMEEGNVEMLQTYVRLPEMIKLVQQTRKVTPSIRDYIQGCEGVEKFNMYFADMELQARAKREISEAFPYVKATTSVVNNIEINHREADKGYGLRALCEYLHIPTQQTMAFGDGDNDTAMLLAAGVGVAMSNAEAGVKAAADYVTLSNEEDGVAVVIEKVVQGLW